jgi:hypothetical protein
MCGESARGQHRDSTGRARAVSFDRLLEVRRASSRRTSSVAAISRSAEIASAAGVPSTILTTTLSPAIPTVPRTARIGSTRPAPRTRRGAPLHLVAALERRSARRDAGWPRERDGRGLSRQRSLVAACPVRPRARIARLATPPVAVSIRCAVREARRDLCELLKPGRTLDQVALETPHRRLLVLRRFDG